MKPQNVLLNLSCLHGCPEPWPKSHSLGDGNCNRGAAWTPGGKAKIQAEEWLCWDELGVSSFAVNLLNCRGFCPGTACCWSVVCSHGWQCWHLLRDGFIPPWAAFFSGAAHPMGICSTLQQSCSLCCLGCQHSSGLAPAGDFGSC